MVKVDLDTGEVEQLRTAAHAPVYAPTTQSAQGRESADHRNARQGLAAVNTQLHDTRAQLGSMTRSAPPLVQFPGIVTGTPADSAAARDFTTKRGQLEQRADSLSGVAGSLAGELSGAASIGPSTSRPTVTPTSVRAPAGPTQQAYDREAQLYKNGIANIRQNFAGAELEARLQAASDRYNQRVQALSTGQRP